MVNELQTLENGEWKYVFCRNELTGMVTTENRRKALRGKDALKYFQTKFAHSEFRLAKRAVENVEWKKWLDARNAEHLAECPELKQLQDKLLSVGGDIVCLQKEPDLEMLLTRGIVTEGKVVLKQMTTCHCHANVAALWSRFEPKVKIVTGWGLSEDGIWRQHTWALRGKTIIETTTTRTKYFGAILTPEEANKFWEDNW